MSEKIPQSIRTSEQQQEKEKKKKELKKFLPVDLQLKFVFQKPEKEKWQFEGELLKRRHSEIDEDKIFYEAITEINKKDIEEIKKLQEKSKEKRKEITDNLDDYLFLKQAMQKCFDEEWPDSAGKIALALNDSKSAKKAMQKCFDKEWLDSAGEIALALVDKDPETAKKAMQECFDKEWLDQAVKIALALVDKDLKTAKKAMQECFDKEWLDQAVKIALALVDKDSETAKQAMQECFDKGWPDKAGEIALALNDLESAKQAMQKCFDKEWPGLAGKIALALNDLESAKKAMQECFDKEWPGPAGEIALALNDLESAKQAMQKCFDKEWPGSAGEIALALVDKDPETAKQAMQKCFDKGWLSSAIKIALALVDKDPEIVKQAMQKCFDKRWPDSAGEIALALNDLESAKKAMQECFDKGWPGAAAKIAVALSDKDPETAKQAMQECFDKEWPGSAGEIALALVDKDPETAKKAMQECFDKGWPGAAAKIALALVDKDPESAKQAMQKCFDKRSSDSAAEIALALAKNFKFIPETERLLKNINELKVDFYDGEKIVDNLLKENQDLGLFKKEYLSKYLFIKKFAQKINDNIEESKKWQNSEEFFDKHNLDIVNLHSIDLNLSTQLLKNLFSRGLSFADTYLNVFKPILDNQKVIEPIKEYIKSNNNLNGYNLSDLLEISSSYHNINDENLFIQTIEANKTKDFKELKSELNRALLKKVAENLGIQTEISEQELSKWKIKYFANLITNQEMLKNKGDEYNLKLFNHLLKSVFENRFNDFISNLNQEDEIGREIAKHNQKVEKEFKEKGINWDNWLNFQERVIMTVDTQKKQDREALFNQFESRFKQWQEQINKYEPRLKSSLEKDLAQLKQKKKEFDPSKINLNSPNWLEELLPSYAKSLKYLQSKDPNFKLPIEVEESFNHLLETIEVLTQEQQKEKTVKKDFIVKAWDRDPKRDMFQGNETACCIAVGVKEAPPGGGLITHHPETIFQYLIDKGINIAEIIDPDTNDVVAQTWLFVTLDQNNKPVLVADNFEINNRYPAGNNVNRGIRESMFQFLTRYAKACNIEKVVLGNVGTNDVEYGDLKSIKLPPIKKLGGYFNDDEYYLETLKNITAREIK